jgi:pyruvate/2-oxoglutarate dehydrogenase complex dihydrolipoamide acyltransferase (E2) component
VLLILEAMKMQNEIPSPVAGVVKKVHVRPGQNVEGKDVLLELEEAPARAESERTPRRVGVRLFRPGRTPRPMEAFRPAG